MNRHFLVELQPPHHIGKDADLRALIMLQLAAFPCDNGATTPIAELYAQLATTPRKVGIIGYPNVVERGGGSSLSGIYISK